jgi:hypothetical protein
MSAPLMPAPRIPGKHMKDQAMTHLLRSRPGQAAILVMLGALAGVTSAAAAESPDSISNELLGPVRGAIGETKFIIDTRLRSESVEQEPLAEDADAITLRARLGFETGKAWETALLAEGEFVEALVDDYRGDNSVATMTTYPVVADPESQEINRLQLVNTLIPGTTVTLGRQRINLDDQRFVGNVGWRQNEQTFDALRVVNRSITGLTLDATYLNQVNRVFGKDSPQGRYEGDGYLANAAYQTAWGKVTGFGYVFDFDPLTFAPPSPGLDPARVSTATYGVRFAGEKPVSRIRLGYVASFATQDDYGGNPLAFSNDYWLGELTATYRQYSLGAGFESLGGDGTAGFAAPLGTLHRFQGWADKFLTTPVNGLEDRYVTAGLQMKGVGWLETFSATATYHDYVSEQLAIDYGDELNLQVQGRWGRVTGTLKYADYRAAATTPLTVRDTSKLWAQIDFVW